MKLKALYGLPNKVIFCKKTLISNQRPNSVIEFRNSSNSKKKTLNIDKNVLIKCVKKTKQKCVRRKIEKQNKLVVNGRENINKVLIVTDPKVSLKNNIVNILVKGVKK